jgi:hypothetical protein
VKTGNNQREILQKGGHFGEDRGEKGKPSKKQGRTGSDIGRKKNIREEEQPQLPPCFLSTATTHQLTAADGPEETEEKKRR